MTQFIKLTCLSLSAPSNFCFIYQSRLEAYPGRPHDIQYNDTQHSNKHDSQAESHHHDNQHNYTTCRVLLCQMSPFKPVMLSIVGPLKNLHLLATLWH